MTNSVALPRTSTSLIKSHCLNNEYLILDWGTSNFRAFLINSQGELKAKKELAMGLLHVGKGDFAGALENILKSWLPSYQETPILMAGMVGSQAGWHDVDYVETPVSNNNLYDSALSFQLPWGPNALIIPGVKHQGCNDITDVMRGEEIQILGLSNLMGSSDVQAILPGTHSKHIRVENNAIVSLKSYMTGELYSALAKHTIIGRDLPTQQTNGKAFDSGVKAAQQYQLSNILFSARTQKLFNKIEPVHVNEYLSGILIGHELEEYAQDKDNSIFLVGNVNLCKKYQRACSVLEIESKIIDGDECFLAGMKAVIV